VFCQCRNLDRSYSRGPILRRQRVIVPYLQPLQRAEYSMATSLPFSSVLEEALLGEPLELETHLNKGPS